MKLVYFPDEGDLVTCNGLRIGTMAATGRIRTGPQIGLPGVGQRQSLQGSRVVQEIETEWTMIDGPPRTGEQDPILAGGRKQGSGVPFRDRHPLRWRPKALES